MRKWKFWIPALLLTIAAAFWLYRHLQIDDCLDGGGRWDYDLGACDAGETNP
jgi:hypothetical protein